MGALIAPGHVALADTTTGPAHEVDDAVTSVTLSPTPSPHNPSLKANFQGFSVESADFAHGFLTEELLADELKTLGPGVIRLGGYSMDLVWPAFGDWADEPAPPEAIGGTVDQSDLDGLKALLDETGWKVTLGAPLKGVIDPSKIKDPTRDPSPRLSMDQVVAEIVAAHRTLGDDLLAVELGNEYDNVTTLTEAELWETAKQYHAAIAKALPNADLRIVGPSANTSQQNARLDQFVAAIEADDSTRPHKVLAELASHWYPWSHCGGRTVTIEQLMSPTTYIDTRNKISEMRAIARRLHDRIPSTLNESNSASCSGMPDVSNAYATSLWSLDYLLQAAHGGVDRLQFHTNTAAVCGDFESRDSEDYPISYRYYGAFCAADEAALEERVLSPTPLYYGLWAFRQVPTGRFLDVDLPDSLLDRLRAHAVRGERGTLTMVLVNVQDPADAESTDVRVTVNLPASYEKGRSVTLRSSAPEGLASVDAGRITLGGQTVTPGGVPSGTPEATTVPVDGRTSTVTVEPGTAQIVTFSH